MKKLLACSLILTMLSSVGTACFAGGWSDDKIEYWESQIEVADDLLQSLERFKELVEAGQYSEAAELLDEKEEALCDLMCKTNRHFDEEIARSSVAHVRESILESVKLVNNDTPFEERFALTPEMFQLPSLEFNGVEVADARFNYEVVCNWYNMTQQKLGSVLQVLNSVIEYNQNRDIEKSDRIAANNKVALDFAEHKMKWFNGTKEEYMRLIEKKPERARDCYGEIIRSTQAHFATLNIRSYKESIPEFTENLDHFMESVRGKDWDSALTYAEAMNGIADKLCDVGRTDKTEFLNDRVYGGFDECPTRCGPDLGKTANEAKKFCESALKAVEEKDDNAAEEAYGDLGKEYGVLRNFKKILSHYSHF